MKKMLLADPGMIFVSGHHREINLEAAKVFVDRGYHVEILANIDYKPIPVDVGLEAITIKPYFTNQPYRDSWITDQTFGIDDYLVPHSTTFAGELESLDTETPLLLPSAFPNQILGATIANWKGAVHALIHRDCNYFSNHPKEHWDFALLEAQKLRRPLKCYVLERSLQKHFAENLKTKMRMQLSPYPLRSFDHTQIIKRTEYIGLLGGLRVDQGRHQMPSNVNAILSVGGKVVLQDSTDIVESAPHPNVKVLGFVEDFRELVGSCAAIVLNYDPASYATASSAIAWEAMMTGTPALHSRHTASAHMFANYNCGIPFDFENHDQFLSALIELKKNYALHEKKARQAAMKFRNAHGMKQFVDFLFKNDLS